MIFFRSRFALPTRLLLPIIITALAACAAGPVEKTPPDSISSPANHLNQGIHEYNNNNYPAAITQFDKALLQYRSIDNQAGIAQSCMNLAKTFMAVNNNAAAAEYLVIANAIVERAELGELSEHLQLLNSSLAIKNGQYEMAAQQLVPVLDSKDVTIRLAALMNRCKIAFVQNDENREQWLGNYKSLQAGNTENTRSHKARILRFESELVDDIQTKNDLLKQSLTISQQLANRPAIAATLTQWAQVLIDTQQYNEAEDKALRALFIRHQLGDVKNTLVILEKLRDIYDNTGNGKHILASQWISKLSSNELNSWGALFSDFDTYPGH